MNRGFLEARSARRLHKPNYFTAEDYSEAIDAVTLELGQALRHEVNEQVFSIADGWEASVALDPSVRKVGSVEIAGVELKAEGLAKVRALQRGNVRSYKYAIEAGRLLIAAPAQAGSYTAYVEPAGVGTATEDTNAVLVAFPLMYLYGVIEQLAAVVQDSELSVAYGNLFRGRVSQLNEQHRALQWGTAPVRSRG